MTPQDWKRKMTIYICEEWINYELCFSEAFAKEEDAKEWMSKDEDNRSYFEYELKV